MISHISAKSLNNGRMIPSGTNSPLENMASVDKLVTVEHTLLYLLEIQSLIGLLTFTCTVAKC